MLKTDAYPASRRIRFLSTVLFATLVSSSATHVQLGLPRTGLPQPGGAIGAGMHPTLAGNPKLQTASYQIAVMINGQKLVPAFGAQSLPRANRRGVIVAVAE
jgi:hypothetical protein